MEVDIQELILNVMRRERSVDEIEFLLTRLLKEKKLEPWTWPPHHVNLSRRSWS